MSQINEPAKLVFVFLEGKLTNKNWKYFLTQTWLFLVSESVSII